jgi:hypothetical protein
LKEQANAVDSVEAIGFDSIESCVIGDVAYAVVAEAAIVLPVMVLM